MELDVSNDVLALNPGLEKAVKGTNPSKYGNVRTTIEGLTFQSGKEAMRCHELMMLERAHEIFALRFQVRFPLPGKSTYVADAVYCELKDSKLEVTVEDTKGFKTQEYKLKKKLFKEKYGIQISEV